MTTLRGPRAPSGDVVIVAIDERSIEAEGVWPWSRARMALLVDSAGGGRREAGRPSTSSGATPTSRGPGSPTWRARSRRRAPWPAATTRPASTGSGRPRGGAIRPSRPTSTRPRCWPTRSSGPGSSPSASSSGATRPARWPPGRRPSGSPSSAPRRCTCSGGTASSARTRPGGRRVAGRSFPSVLPPVEELVKVSDSGGYFTVLPDADGVIRRYLLVASAGGSHLPGAGRGPAGAGQGARRHPGLGGAGGRGRLQRAGGGPRRRPGDPHRRLRARPALLLRPLPRLPLGLGHRRAGRPGGGRAAAGASWWWSGPPRRAPRTSGSRRSTRTPPASSPTPPSSTTCSTASCWSGRSGWCWARCWPWRWPRWRWPGSSPGSARWRRRRPCWRSPPSGAPSSVLALRRFNLVLASGLPLMQVLGMFLTATTYRFFSEERAKRKARESLLAASWRRPSSTRCWGGRARCSSAARSAS